MALMTVTVHGEILDPNGLTPAVGTVSFAIPQKLRDIVDNIVYSPSIFTATLDINGEFTIVLPATDSPDVEPPNWVYSISVNTDVLSSQFFAQIPFAPGVTELADLIQLDYDPCTGAIAGTVFIPTDADLFVLKAGDTMTGNLIINANLQVSGSANVDGTLTVPYTGTTFDVAQLLTMGLSTSVISGGILSVNADPTKLDITALTGYIVDYNSSVPLSPTNPSVTYVSLPAQTALVLTGPPAQVTTWWLVDSVGTIIQQPNAPTPAQRRTHLALGATAQFAGFIFLAQTLPVTPSQPVNQFADLADALHPFSISGNEVSANGVNLTINKSAGVMFARAFSQDNTYLDPHSANLAAQSPVSCRRATAVAVLPALETLIDVANYDPGGLGVVTPVGGGANTSTNFRVWGFGSSTIPDQMAIQYGQTTHASLTAARDALGSGTYIPAPQFELGTVLGWISVTRTAVDLSNPTQAIFTHAGRFAHP